MGRGDLGGSQVKWELESSHFNPKLPWLPERPWTVQAGGVARSQPRGGAV